MKKEWLLTYTSPPLAGLNIKNTTLPTYRLKYGLFLHSESLFTFKLVLQETWGEILSTNQPP